MPGAPAGDKSRKDCIWGGDDMAAYGRNSRPRVSSFSFGRAGYEDGPATAIRVVVIADGRETFIGDGGA